MPDDPSPPDTPSSGDQPSRISLRERLARLIGGAQIAQQLPAPGAQHEEAATPSAIRLRLTDFETASVRDVMTSRVDIAAIEVSATLGDVLKLFAAEAHSRMPVFRDSLDDPLGFIHIKDIVAELARGDWKPETLASRPLERLMRDIMFVPESMLLPDLLVQMQARRIHIAIVVDEYGGAGGIVCLEDLVEQIVGEIEDEHREEAPRIVRRGRNTWDVDGLAEIADVEKETRLSLHVEAFEDNVDTIGGLVAALAGRLPEQGEVIDHPSGKVLEVTGVDPRRVTRVRIRNASRPAAAAVAAPATEPAERG